MTQSNRTADVKALLSELGENPSFLSTGGRALVTIPNTQNFFLDDSVRGRVRGTATDLFNEICVTASPRALAHRLRILAPKLPVVVELSRIHKGVRQITLTNPSPCYAECLIPQPNFVGQIPRSAPDSPVALCGHTKWPPEAGKGVCPTDRP